MTVTDISLRSAPQVRMGRWSLRKPSVLPGFGLTLGFTLCYLSLIVLIPLAGLILAAAGFGWAGFWSAVTTPRVLAAFRVSFGTSLMAALVNAVFGLLVAWVLVRYEFPGKRIVDAIVDLPFALPTAVAGIALTALYTPQRLDRCLAGADGDQGRLHSARHHRGADLHRAAVRRPHGAAGASGSRRRRRKRRPSAWAPPAGRHSAG